MKRLNLNRIEMENLVSHLATENGVTVSQLVSYLNRNFYASRQQMTTAQKVHRHAVAIANMVK